MDGSTSAFLYDVPFLSDREDEYAGGILYIEDFDCDVRTRTPAAQERETDTAPLITQADLELARAEGHADGLQSALADANHTQAQLEAAALQNLGESLLAARATLERVAASHAAECARAVLALITAALPATMARHGWIEIQAMLDALLPELVFEPELRVRAHPDLADTVREHLAERLPADGIVLSVIADTKLEPGDAEVAWHQGQARRDCKAVWNAVRAAVGDLGLPAFEEVCHPHGT